MTMKLNKSKGKVHPSPSSSSSSSSSSSFSVSSSCHSQVDPVSSLNLLLPAAILTLISVLSLPDREVLAYMITRSLKSPLTLEEIPNSNSNSTNNRKKSKPKKSNSNPTHKSPTFDCDCFQCYTTYWFRWDSSPHRELIHQAIEAFEEHLATAERTATSAAGKPSRRREKFNTPPPPPTTKTSPAVVEEKGVVAVVAEPELGSPENENVLEAGSPESVAGEESTATATENEVAVEEEKEQKLQREEQQQQHKGLARKMLPDVIGLFNSRLWNLWGPNV